jgi:hypothetical protein
VDLFLIKNFGRMGLNKYFLSSIFFLFISILTQANPFEGIIYFQKTDEREVNFFRYYIKGDKVRIEDVDEKGELNGILLIDMTKISLKMLSCGAQLYIEVPISEQVNSPKIKVDRTGDIKMIAGKECERWKIIDTEKYSSFEFWVNEGNYPFLNPMLRMLNRNDNIALAWIGLMIGDNYFPFKGTEFSSTGKELTKLEVIDIKEMTLDDELFVIPSNYSLFERKISN